MPDGRAVPIASYSSTDRCYLAVLFTFRHVLMRRRIGRIRAATERFGKGQSAES
jgi:hypothetical protein